MSSREKKPPQSLQESILTVLALDESFGAKIASHVSGHHFDETYRPLAEKLLDYWNSYGRPPGKAHFDDLIDTLLLERKREDWEEINQLVAGMIAQAEQGGLNAAYVYSQLDRFISNQVLKATLIRASDRFQQGGEDRRDAVVKIMEDGLRKAQTNTAETHIMPINEVCALSVKPPEMLIEPWLEAGDVAMLHSPPGHAKTLLLMHLGVALARGKTVFRGKWDVHRSARVLYYDGELPINKLMRRLQRFEFKPRHLYVLSRRYARQQGADYPSLYEREGRAMLDRAIAECKAEVIVLDSIFTLFGVVTEKEADKWIEVSRWLAGHQDEGRSFILVHHDAKGSVGNAYGTVLRSVLVDMQISLVPVKPSDDDEDDDDDDRGDAREVRFLKHREFGGPDAEPFILYLKVEDDHYEWRWVPKSQARLTSARRRAAEAKKQRILALLDEGMSVAEVAKEVGCSPTYVRKVRKQRG